MLLLFKYSRDKGVILKDPVITHNAADYGDMVPLWIYLEKHLLKAAREEGIITNIGNRVFDLPMAVAKLAEMEVWMKTEHLGSSLDEWIQAKRSILIPAFLHLLAFEPNIINDTLQMLEEAVNEKTPE
jgi:hypothetical protein